MQSSALRIYHRLSPDELPGWWARRVEVGEGQRAVLVQEGGELKVLPPGRHLVGGLLASLRGQGRVRDVAIIGRMEFPLHLSVGGLLTGDGELVEADFLLRLRIADPAAFYHAFAKDREALTTADLAALIAEKAESPLKGAVRHYIARDLRYTDQVACRIAADLSGFLASCMEPAGLKLEGLGFLAFFTAEEAVKRAQALRSLRHALRSEEMKERIQAARSEKELQDILKQLEHEYRLRDLFRREELESIREEILAQGVGDVEAFDRVLQKRLGELQESLLVRFDKLLRRLGFEEKKPDRLKKLGRWVNILKAMGYIIISVTTLLTVFMPEFFEDPRLPRIITATVGLFLAIIAILSSFWMERRVKRGREEALRAQVGMRRANPPRKRALERLVRARVEGELEKASLSLKEAWTKAYRGALRPLSTPLRTFERELADFREEVRAAHYEVSKYLDGPGVLPDQFLAVLELDEGILELSRRLAERGEALYRGVMEGREDAVREGLQEMEVDLQMLRNRFKERGAILKA